MQEAAKPLSGEVFGALINLSGRRRFTSQRLVLYAVLAAQGQEGAAAIAREALQLFRDAHHILLNGSDSLPGIFCPELEEATTAAPTARARSLPSSTWPSARWTAASPARRWSSWWPLPRRSWRC